MVSGQVRYAMNIKPERCPRNLRRVLGSLLACGFLSALALVIYLGFAGVGRAAEHPMAARSTGMASSPQQGAPGVREKTGNPRQGEALAAAHCASCHGDNGNSSKLDYPKLAGQDAAYLYRQLWAFKEGQRPSAVMQAIVAPLSDIQLADVSAYYESQSIQADPVTDRALADTGRQIYYAGRPSCAMCHDGGGMPMMGMMGGGMNSSAPKLAGQHALYTLQQLDAFASGQRQGGVMNRIAAQLSDSQRKAIAEYIAVRH